MRAGVNLLLALCCVVQAGPSALAQAGDRKDEVQSPLPEDLVIPAAPARTPAEAQALFRLPPDFVIEAVATEPLVQDPVAMAFDADGSLLVVEMCAYMPDVDGRGEREPLGNVVRLIDANGDGRFEQRIVVLDRLVLPRAVAPTRGGLLVIAPPELLFVRDEDGDGHAEERRTIDRGLGGIESPEHAINALLPTLDNAFHCANVPWRYRFDGNTWKREAISFGGQWGAAKDDRGRIYHNNNSDPLRVDRLDPRDAARNPNLGTARFANQRVVDDMRPAPARMNPGINRGYEPGMLDANHRLARITGACAPLIVRGTALGAAWRGRALVCEPTGNLVLAYQLEERAGAAPKGIALRNPDGLDFLTSTDERFRPVALCEGPDGALYIADMYRGLIQHRLFVTSFLRKQVLERGLEQPLHHGRIWRVRAAGQALAHPGALSDWDAPQLVRALESESGWVRDTAQRLLVEDWADSAAAHAALRRLATESAAAHARVHALHALHGMGGLRSETALAALSDAAPWVRATALRVSATLAGTQPEVFARWQALREDADPLVREALVLALGDLPGAAGGKLLGELLWQHAGDALLSTAALSGLFGRELEVLQAWPHTELSSAQAAQVTTLIQCIAREGRSERLLATLELWSERTHWRTAIESGWKQAPRRGAGAIALAIDPKFAPDDPRRAFFRVPGEADTAALRPLTMQEMRAFERGRELYSQTCAACHLSSGSGSPGIAPTLVGSPWVLEDPTRAIRILLHGLRGEITVEGERFDADMPAFSAGNEDLAAVLTYIRREWGNNAEPVSGEQVRVQRERDGTRSRAWTVPELD